MKKNNKSVEVKVKPTRAERRHEKNMQAASEQLENYHRAAEFHIAYLEIEHDIEEAKLRELEEKIAALKPQQEQEVVETVTEERREIFDNDVV